MSVAELLKKDGLFLVESNRRIKALKIPSPVKGYKVVDKKDLEGKVDDISSTEFESVYIVSLASSKKKDSEFPISYRGLFPKCVKDIIEEYLAPKLKQEILVLRTNQEFAGLKLSTNTNELFRVHIGWSPNEISEYAEEEGEGWYYPSSMWGIYAGWDGDEHGPFYEWAEADGIIRTKEGHAVAAYDEHNLCIYPNFAIYHNTNHLEILKKILQEFKPIKPTTLGFSKDAYIKACIENSSEVTKNLSDDIDRTKARIQEARSIFVRATREFDLLQRKKKKGVTNEEAKEFYSNQFDMIASNPLVERLELTKDSIVVHTKLINAFDRKLQMSREIGKFRIIISIANGGVSFFNKTRRVNRCHHPHVDSDGEPCLGNILFTMAEFASHHEYSSLIDMAFAFLLQASSGGAFESLESWPEVRKKKEVKKKKVAKKKASK